MRQLLEARDAGLAGYSVPPRKGLEGSDDEIREGTTQRISTASAVLVLNTPGLHRREWSSFEMKTATEMDKRIIVVQPHANFRQPTPTVLDNQIYRVAKWRSDVVGRAIRGEYPHDGRVFDLAETSERREIVKFLSIGAGVVSIVVLVRKHIRARAGPWPQWPRRPSESGRRLAEVRRQAS